MRLISITARGDVKWNCYRVIFVLFYLIDHVLIVRYFKFQKFKIHAVKFKIHPESCNSKKLTILFLL